MTSLETIHVLLVNYRRPELLSGCLESLQEFLPLASVHVWDNQSGESFKVRELAVNFPNVDWIFWEENIGFAAAVNRLAERCESSDFFLLLNPDAILTGSLQPLLDAMDAPDVAASGPCFPTTSGAPRWDNARRLSDPVSAAVELAGAGAHFRGTRFGSRYGCYRAEVGYLSGACLLLRAAAWCDVGPFDEQFWLYSEEMDWAKRAHDRGWRIVQVDQYLVSHTSGGTVADDAALRQVSERRLELSVRDYLRKHHGYVGLLRFTLLRIIVRAIVVGARTIFRIATGRR